MDLRAAEGKRAGLGAWGFPVLVLALTLLGPVLLYWVFEVAPVEARMGIVQKIFYFHVPSAIAMYLAFCVCGVASLAYLVSQKPGWDAAASSGAEVGLVFGALVLTTGPLWGRGAWGAWWVWEDPQLTATLLLVLIYVTYLFLRRFLGEGSAARRVPAILAVVGLVDIPLIHVATRLWRGQHPRVMRSGGGGLAPSMLQAFGIGVVAFALLAVLLVWLRYRVAWAARRCDDLWVDVQARPTPPASGPRVGRSASVAAATLMAALAGGLLLGGALLPAGLGTPVAWAQPATTGTVEAVSAPTVDSLPAAPAPEAASAPAAPARPAPAADGVAAPPRPGSLGFRLMVAAYGLIWGACLLYLLYLGRKQAGLERDIEELRAQLQPPQDPASLLDSPDRTAVP